MEAFVFHLLFVLSVSGTLDTEYSNSAFLDEAETYKLYWKVNSALERVSFAVKVKTLGWVGFGISAGKGNMVGSDVAMGWVKNGKGFLQDRFAEEKSLPSMDAPDHQDYKLEKASEEEGYTILQFHRKIDTCDKRDRKLEEGTVRVVYAYNSEDPTCDNCFIKHTKRGSRTLILLNVLEQKPSLPNDLQHFDLTQNKTILPNKDTTYLCKAFEFPQMPNKHQIVKIEPVISSGNEGRVHHMLVYRCTNSFPRSNLSAVTTCYQNNMVPGILDCVGDSPIAGWGIGGGPFYYPDHVGFPIGANIGPQYVVLEIHYDNPKLEAGIVDSSGFRFYYTSKLRKYDSGILWVGWDPRPAMAIPPQQKSWTSIGYCSSKCTEIGFQNSTLPDKGINIFATLQHTHLQGIKMRTRHVRNGEELKVIARDNHYNFNYQEYQVSRNETHVKPGDDIIQMCTYQTMDKTQFVLGGLSTKNEMCMAFIMYYPKIDMIKCMSVNSVGSAFVYHNFWNGSAIVGYPPSNWTQQHADSLKAFYRNTTHVYSVCRDQNGDRLPLANRDVPKPKVTKPLMPEKDVCPAEPPTASASLAAESCVFYITSMIIAFLNWNK